MPKQRRGTVLILMVILLFALMAVAGLLLDVGMARLTQTHMQSVADAVAMEGGWELAGGSDAIDIRQSSTERADEATESWGARRIVFEPGGFDLDDDGVQESSLTIDRETYGDPAKPTLDANLANAPEGDIVLGVYDADSVPESLPGQPMGYDRGTAFEPSPRDDANAVLVRLRRTGETDLTGGTSAEPLTYLWSRGSLMDLGLKGRGVSVRGESIAKMVPAVAVGTAVNSDLPTAINAAIELADVMAGRFTDIVLRRPENPFQIGSRMVSDPPEDGIGYLPIVSSVTVGDSSEYHVVGFMLASVQGNDVTPMALSDMGYERTNVTANPGWITNRLSGDLMRTHHSLQELEEDFIARAPRLVRSRQIQSGDSP